MYSSKSLKVAFLIHSDLALDKASSIRARITVDAMAKKFTTRVFQVKADPGAHKSISPTARQPTRRRIFRLISKPISFYRGMRRFSRDARFWLEQVSPDVIHVFMTGAIAPALSYKRKHPKTRLIFEMHGLSFLELKGVRFFERLTYFYLDTKGARKSDAVIAMSYTQRDFLKRWFRVASEKVHVIWGPVDLELFKYTNPPPKSFVVGYSGNDNFWQGIDALLQAAKLLEEQSDICFLLSGFSSEAYQHYKLSNVTFADIVPREEVPKMLGGCHVLVSPRIKGAVTQAQYPFKLSAYLAAGRPIVATQVNDQERILKQSGCGIIVSSGDARGIAAAIEKIKAMSDAERLNMGQNAREFAKRYFSLEYLTDELTKLYTNNALIETSSVDSQKSNSYNVQNMNSISRLPEKPPSDR